MPFGLMTRVGPGNHVLHWGRPTVKYRDTLRSSVKTAKPIKMPYWTVRCGGDAVFCQITLTTLITTIRPHRPYYTYVHCYKFLTVYVRIDAVYCYRPSSTVCRSVCHNSEPCRNGRTDQDAVCVVDSGGPKEAQVQSYSPNCANVL